MITTTTFAKTAAAMALNPRYIDSEGGTRSGKTYSNLQLLSIICPADPEPTITSVVSENLPHLKRGAIRDFQKIMAGDGRWNEKRWNRTDCIYEFPNGSILEFFGCDSPGKVHGPARTRLFINEAQNVDWEVARQLMVRTTGLVMWDYNPTHRFWAHEQFEADPECVHVHSTYKDNEQLAAWTVKDIERNKNDKSWWRVYGQGLVGVLEGQIYQNFTLVDSLPDPAGFTETYGLDFGFTNDPTAIVHCLIHTGRKEIWLDEVCYQRGLDNGMIAALLKQQGLRSSGGPVVYADCAEPKSISEINSYGLNVLKSDKGAKIKDQALWINGFRLFVTKRSVNLTKELRNYQWQKKADGTLTNEPVDIWNHACDAFRYGCYTPFSQFTSGQYVVSIK